MSLTTVIESGGQVFLALAVCGAVYACAATWAIWRFLRRSARGPTAHPSISVLKPLHGDEPELFENLASFCAQDYDGPVQLILAVQDAADPALAVARRLKAEYAGRDIVVVCDPTVHGANRKIGNLINCAGLARGEVIVISDSDVRLPTDGLSRLVAALEQPGVGLVHALYRGRGAAGFWSCLAAMDINTRFAPSVVVGEALGAHPCLGPTMALKADTLARIGGFAYLADFLADDFELGRAVRAAGYTLACPPMLVDHVFPDNSAKAMLRRELRWARTIRLLEPNGYLGSGVTHFASLALIGAALTGFTGKGLIVATVLVALRLVQVAILNVLMGAEGGLWWLTPVRDLLSFAVYGAAFFGDRVEWRGSLMRVGRDGAMAAT